MAMHISFHGGVDTVTGSCHLLKAGGLNVLIDCGYFQGRPEWEKRNFDEFGFDPSSIDYLLLTHGHLDHCGRIPLLVKRGFQGKIITTSATYDIAKIVVMDSARIQEEDYEYWKRINPRKTFVRRGPLYTTEDALDCLQYFSTISGYGKPVPLNGRVTATFRDAGHIFGAAFIEIDVKGEGRILFSGDLGNRNKPIIRDPEPPGPADVVVIEGTYSNRNHKGMDQSIEELREAIARTAKNQGNVLIPSFAIERAQDILYFLREMYYRKELPQHRVFLDSPMGISVTNVMRRYPEYFDREARAVLEQDRDPFMFPGVEFTRTQDASRQINYIKKNAIIIAGSGMCTGGRIKHHLAKNIRNKKASIIFIGYQAQGTLGRKIIEKNREVKIFGKPFPVNAKVYTIGGFSAHADNEILCQWLEHTGRPKHIFLVHGEKKVLQSFQKELTAKNQGKNIHVPGFQSTYSL